MKIGTKLSNLDNILQKGGLFLKIFIQFLTVGARA